MTNAGTSPGRAVGFALLLVLALAAFAFVMWVERPGPGAGRVVDEAFLAGRADASVVAADEDYFHDMDSGVQLTPDEVKGRNTWIVWTGGNDRFWDRIGVKATGALDFLKTISSH